MSRSLEVLLHGRPIGFLTEVASGAVEFRFSDAYFEQVPRPVLGQRFEDDPKRTYRSRKGQALPDFFANLIPEGRLREVIEKTVGLDAGDDLALLAFVGRDLPGAVAVQPMEDSWPTGSETLVGPLDEAEEVSSANPDTLRFSLAGVQLKFSMLREGKHLAVPARDREGEWIVKFPSPTFPHLPENELAMLTWAREAGFDIPECHLHDVEDIERFPRHFAPAGSRVLAVRRYDRSPAGRIHQEDFAQAVGLPPVRKYDHLTFEVMARLVRRFIDEEAVDELVRRLTLVIASGNNDSHLKNWSLLYPDTIQARWSPAYDQVATVAWPALERTLALNLAGLKEFGRIDREAFVRFAQRAALDTTRVLTQVDETIVRLRRAWRNISTDLPLPSDHADALREHWRRVPLLREAGGLEEG